MNKQEINAEIDAAFFEFFRPPRPQIPVIFV